MYDTRPLVDQMNAPLPRLTTDVATHPTVVELNRRLDVLLEAVHDAARAAADGAEAGIGLFREYVEVHGHDEDRAAAAAIAEIRQGTEAIVEIPGRLDALAYATRFTYGTGSDPVHAEQRGPDTWVVRRRDLLLAGDEWVEDRSDSRLDEQYLAATRMSRAQALREAASVVEELAAAGHLG